MKKLCVTETKQNHHKIPVSKTVLPCYVFGHDSVKIKIYVFFSENKEYSHIFIELLIFEVLQHQYFFLLLCLNVFHKENYRVSHVL